MFDEVELVFIFILEGAEEPDEEATTQFGDESTTTEAEDGEPNIKVYIGCNLTIAIVSSLKLTLYI